MKSLVVASIFLGVAVALDAEPAGLSSWLYAATWVFPPLPAIPLTSGFFSINVKISGLACSNFRVAKLRSSWTPPTAAAPVSLTLGVDGLSLNCSTSEVTVNI